MRGLGRLGLGLTRRQSTSSAFSPTDIAGLAAWFDPSDETSITETAGAVSQIDDKSGNLNHATQGTGALQPTTGTRTINSLNVLDFDNDLLALTSAVSRTSGYTFFCVINSDSLVTEQNFISGVGGSFTFRADNTTGTLQIVRTAEAVILGSTNPITTGTDYILSARTESSVNNIQINGADEGSNTTDPIYTADSSTIGQDVAPSDPINGELGEWLLYEGTLTDAQMNQVGNYLSPKWGPAWAGL